MGYILHHDLTPDFDAQYLKSRIQLTYLLAEAAMFEAWEVVLNNTACQTACTRALAHYFALSIATEWCGIKISRMKAGGPPAGRKGRGPFPDGLNQLILSGMHQVPAVLREVEVLHSSEVKQYSFLIHQDDGHLTVFNERIDGFQERVDKAIEESIKAKEYVGLLYVFTSAQRTIPSLGSSQSQSTSTGSGQTLTLAFRAAANREDKTNK